MLFQYDDGGREAAGFSGKNAGDCVTRAICIASGKPYFDIYVTINLLAKHERTGCRKSGTSSANVGVYRTTYNKVLKQLGAKWVPTMGIGTGCKVHLRDGELPMGKLVASVSKHLVAVIDGVIHDTFDCSRDGTRCVYGYWILP